MNSPAGGDIATPYLGPRVVGSRPFVETWDPTGIEEWFAAADLPISAQTTQIATTITVTGYQQPKDPNHPEDDVFRLLVVDLTGSTVDCGRRAIDRDDFRGFYLHEVGVRMWFDADATWIVASLTPEATVVDGDQSTTSSAQLGLMGEQAMLTFDHSETATRRVKDFRVLNHVSHRDPKRRSNVEEAQVIWRMEMCGDGSGAYRTPFDLVEPKEPPLVGHVRRPTDRANGTFPYAAGVVFHDPAPADQRVDILNVEVAVKLMAVEKTSVLVPSLDDSRTQDVKWDDGIDRSQIWYNASWNLRYGAYPSVRRFTYRVAVDFDNQKAGPA